MSMKPTPKGSNARKPTPMSEAIAAQIRAERSARNITKDEMIRQTGIGRATYFDLERGSKPIDVSQLAAVLGVLGLSISEFMRRAEVRLREDGPAQGEADRRKAQ